MKYFFPVLILSLGALANLAQAQEFTVKSREIADQKMVFATVESVDRVAARARIGGTIVSLDVREGDFVNAGEEIALVGDDKLALQIKTLDAQIAGLEAQDARARADLKRIQTLISSKSVSQAALDAAKATASGAANELKAVKAQRQLIEQQVTEGKILSPADGRVLQVPLTAGSVIMAGENVATIAVNSYILRLQLPERHARFLKAGDPVRLEDSKKTGKIVLVYPEIDNGRVVADAEIEGLENYFVGERVRVWVSTAERDAYLIPESYIITRSGVDYVSLKTDGTILEIPVQRGHARDQEGNGNGLIEILSGLHDGDILVGPKQMETEKKAEGQE